jgi:hypothetical protein
MHPHKKHWILANQDSWILGITDRVYSMYKRNKHKVFMIQMLELPSSFISRQIILVEEFEAKRLNAIQLGVLPKTKPFSKIKLPPILKALKIRTVTAILMLTSQSLIHYPNSGAQTMPPLASSNDSLMAMIHTDHSASACGQIADSGSNAACGSARLGAILACQSARPSPCERLASTCQLAQEARTID